MASSLRLLTSKLVTRSFGHPTVVAASRFFTIEAAHQSYTTMPEDCFYDQSCPRILCPKISSMLVDMSVGTDQDNEWSLELKIPNCEIDGSTSKENLCITKRIHGLEKKELKACVEHKSKMHKEGINLPVKSSNDINKEINIMANILANDIIASFHDISAKHSWAYYDMFYDRSIVVSRFYPLIAMQSPISSFSIYKTEYENSLRLNIRMPGEEEMKLTPQGLQVAVYMDDEEVKREDVKVFFDYNDILFIEGKRDEKHYITGICLPKGIKKKHNMIERYVKDGEFYAIIPCVNKEEI